MRQFATHLYTRMPGVMRQHGRFLPPMRWLRQGMARIGALPPAARPRPARSCARHNARVTRPLPPSLARAVSDVARAAAAIVVLRTLARKVAKPNNLYCVASESESHVRRGGLFLSRSMQAGARGRAGVLMPSLQDDALTAHEGGGKDAKTVRPKPFKKKWG